MSLLTLWQREAAAGGFLRDALAWREEAGATNEDGPAMDGAEAHRRGSRRREAALECCASMRAQAWARCGGDDNIAYINCRPLPMRGSCEGSWECKSGEGEIVFPGGAPQPRFPLPGFPGGWPR